MPLTEGQEEALSELISFGDEDEDDRILYADEGARPDEPWYNLELGTAFIAEYGDPQTLPALYQALDAYEIPDTESNVFAHQAVIELYAAIEELGGQPTPSQQEKRERVMGLRGVGRRLMKDGVRWEAEQESVRKDRKLGRNDPCWCGSGKKYKRCHWASDRSGGR